MAIVFGSPEALKIRDADRQTEMMYLRHTKEFLLIAQVVAKYGDDEKLAEMIRARDEIKKLNGKLRVLEADSIDIGRAQDGMIAAGQASSTEFSEARTKDRELQHDVDEICRLLIPLEHNYRKTQNQLLKLTHFSESVLSGMSASSLLCFHTLPDAEKRELTLIALGRKEASQ